MASLAMSACARPSAPEPAAPAPEPAAASAPTEAEPAMPADTLLLLAVSTDAAQAQQAMRQIERMGQCPHLADSPESPVGLLVAAYDNAQSDAARIRELISLLQRQGCDIDQYNATGLTPLHNAILYRQPELVDFLIRQGADPLLRTIYVPGQASGQKTANLDALGFALALKARQPDQPVYAEMADTLRKRGAIPAQ